MKTFSTVENVLTQSFGIFKNKYFHSSLRCYKRYPCNNKYKCVSFENFTNPSFTPYLMTFAAVQDLLMHVIG